MSLSLLSSSPEFDLRGSSIALARTLITSPAHRPPAYTEVDGLMRVEDDATGSENSAITGYMFRHSPPTSGPSKKSRNGQNIDSLRSTPGGKQQGARTPKETFSLSCSAHRIASRWGVAFSASPAGLPSIMDGHKTAFSHLPFPAALQRSVPETLALRIRLVDTVQTCENIAGLALSRARISGCF